MNTMSLEADGVNSCLAAPWQRSEYEAPRAPGNGRLRLALLVNTETCQKSVSVPRNVDESASVTGTPAGMVIKPLTGKCKRKDLGRLMT